eukprot:5535795-Pyramimonas_sp.AAC.1
MEMTGRSLVRARASGIICIRISMVFKLTRVGMPAGKHCSSWLRKTFRRYQCLHAIVPGRHAPMQCIF